MLPVSKLTERVSFTGYDAANPKYYALYVKVSKKYDPSQLLDARITTSPKYYEECSLILIVDNYNFTETKKRLID